MYNIKSVPSINKYFGHIFKKIDNQVNSHYLTQNKKMNPGLNLIAAACEGMGIGINGNLPWRLK